MSDTGNWKETYKQCSAAAAAGGVRPRMVSGVRMLRSGPAAAGADVLSLDIGSAAP